MTMQKSDAKSSKHAPAKTRSVEVTVAILCIAFGLLVITDSARIGASWGNDGPQSGYFPFRIGIILVIGSVLVLLNTLRLWNKHDQPFIEHEQLRHVLSVFLPTCVYIGLIFPLGLYVASAIFIAWFMHTHGKFAIPKVSLVSIGVPVTLFLLFEIWFLVPLPKGPLERLLGY